MALAPLIRGGNRHVALIALEWLALLVLLLLALRRPGAGTTHAQGLHAAPLSRAEWVLILSPLWAAVLYLMPLPMDLWAALPGHGPYAQVLAAAQAPAAGWRPLSLTPDATLASLLAGLPVVAAFVLARLCSAPQLGLLLRALVLFALVQAVLGLLQAGPFDELYFGAMFAGAPIGSFANANHLASYIAMTLPLAVLLLWQSLPGRRRSGQRPRPQAAAVLWSLLLFILLAAVLASSSRTGGATALLVTLLAVLLVLRGGHSRQARRWRLLGAAALLLAVAAAVGMQGFVARLGAGDLGGDASFRWQLTRSSWQAAQAFWPLGSGPGSYASVYPQFQPPGLHGFAEHAHNDYVQLLMEAGALFVVLAGLAGWLLARQGAALWRQARTQGHLQDAAVLQLCCALGLLAVLLHAWVDFNLRIPALAMLAACLLGACLRPLHARPEQSLPPSSD